MKSLVISYRCLALKPGAGEWPSPRTTQPTTSRSRPTRTASRRPRSTSTPPGRGWIPNFFVTRGTLRSTIGLVVPHPSPEGTKSRIHVDHVELLHCGFVEVPRVCLPGPLLRNMKERFLLALF